MPDYGVNAATFAPPPPPQPQPASLQLRPLSLGEILDRSFTLYRQRFWLYCGIASVSAAIATLGSFARLTFGLTSPRTADNSSALLISLTASVVAGLLYFFAYSITQAATVSAVSAAYLGRETSIAAALDTVKPHWPRYILIAVWQAFSASWLTSLLGAAAIPFLALPQLHLRWLGGLLLALAALGIVYGIVAYIRNSIGIVASITEDLKVPAAMRRSKQLVSGSKGRVLAILLITYVLNLVAGVLQGAFAVFFTLSHATAARIGLEALTLILVFTTSTLVAPVPAIAFCLFYIDQRVRKEGYDLELLMESAPSAAPPGPPHSAPGPA